MLRATLSHSAYDVLTRRATMGMASLEVMHVSNYTAVDAMIVRNENLYTVLAGSSSYLRVCQEGTDCLIAVLGLSVCE
jgi:hypothetical protein